MPSCCYRLRFSDRAVPFVSICSNVPCVFMGLATLFFTFMLQQPINFGHLFAFWAFGIALAVCLVMSGTLVRSATFGKSALFRHLRRSTFSRRSRTINKKTRLSGADAVKRIAPFVRMAPGPCARKRRPNAWFIRTKPVVAMGKHRCACTWF